MSSSPDSTPPSPSPPSSAAPGPLRVALSATLFAALATALADLALASSRASDPVPLGSFVSALSAAVALYAAPALLVGVCVGLVLGGLQATFGRPVRDVLRGWVRSIRSDEPDAVGRDRAQAAGVLAAGGAAGVLAAIVFAFARALALEMASKRNGALSTALVAAAALPVCALAWFPLYRALRGPASLLPRPRVLVALSGLALVGLLGALFALLSVDWRVLNFGPAIASLAFALLATLHAWLWYVGPGVRVRERSSVALRSALWGVALLAIATASAATWSKFGDDPRATALVAEESSGARPLLAVARHLADRDGDGFAGRLGGGDCNDHDKTVYPGAEETPGDGIDQDCSGEDAPLASAAPQQDNGAAQQHSAAPQHPATPRLVEKTPQRVPFDGNLLVITIDTLRADRLNPKVMPHLGAWAKDAVVFTHAYAQAPNTPRSFPSFLTGRFPSRVKWAREFANFSPITDANRTFFMALHDGDIRTVGEFSHFYLTPAMGIHRGFDEWDNAGALTLHDSNTDIAAPRITARVVKKLEQLASSPKRFALWTHFFEPHSRYMEHDEFPVHSSGMKGLEEKYDGEVSYVDLHLQQIFDALHKTGLDKNTAVVVFADHGEAFGEHRFGGEQMYFHGQTLYDELLRVPLVVKVPGQPAVKPRAVDDKVMLVDLAPTVCELMGVPPPLPPTALDGRSLVGALAGEPLSPRPVYAEMLAAPSWNHSWRVLVDGDRKLLYKVSESSLELYDVAKDPREQHNLAASEPQAVATMKQSIAKVMAGGAP